MSYARDLSADEEALLEAEAATWRGHVGSVEPCDRPAAEALVVEAYTAMGHPAPARIVWMDSPLGGVLAARMFRERVRPMRVVERIDPAARAAAGRIVARLAEIAPQDIQPVAWFRTVEDMDVLKADMHAYFYRRQKRHEIIWRNLVDRLRSEFESHLGSPIQYGMWSDVDDVYPAADLWKAVNDRLDTLIDGEERDVHDRVDAEHFRLLHRAMPPGVQRELINSVIDSVGLPPDPEWMLYDKEHGGGIDPWRPVPFLAAFRCAYEIAGMPPSPELAAVARVVRAVGWWWPMTDTAVLTDRPVQYRTTVRAGWPASEEPLLLAYADGFQVRLRQPTTDPELGADVGDPAPPAPRPEPRPVSPAPSAPRGWRRLFSRRSTPNPGD
ncbi:hypothetical protein CA850_22035 [Micromonospora echinospora]|uniref:DUF6745 domain-containing protein n=1 Tax=Micromonospora echinospora TaxID=1877 RepID=A0A1C4URL8_MICEC|nr:hypothetical protein [Micromonospora echinospora]OZV77657.1 hypothetical protein CA850_22035 [Micromonospora echinospora]SCE74271.1 hypothetical protein GA0070618_0577 [Micromonospora echinospora]